MRRTNTFVCAFAAFAVLTVRPALGGISLISDDRTVAISGQAVQINPNPPPFSLTGPAYSHSATATPFAAFDQSFSDSSAANGATLSSASANQTSSFELSAAQLTFTASGGVKYASATPDSPTSAASSYKFTFSLDATTTYTISEEFGPNAGAPENDNSITNTGAVLLNGTPSTLDPNASLIPAGSRLSAGSETFTGTLPAGQYTFGGLAFGNSTADGGNATFDVQFTLSQSGTSTTPPVTAAAPLPPAVWSGLGTIGLLAGAAAARTKRWSGRTLVG